jgi:hypothetical protein
MAGEAIRGSAQETCHGGHGRPSPEAIETGAVEGGPALAVITIDVLFGDRPLGGCRHGVAEATPWLVKRLRLLRTVRQDTAVESDCHGVPPEEALTQGQCLRCVPSPMAEGTGMPNPIVVPRHAVLCLSGVHASLCACVPPA